METSVLIVEMIPPGRGLTRKGAASRGALATHLGLGPSRKEKAVEMDRIG